MKILGKRTEIYIIGGLLLGACVAAFICNGNGNLDNESGSSVRKQNSVIEPESQITTKTLSKYKSEEGSEGIHDDRVESFNKTETVTIPKGALRYFNIPAFGGPEATLDPKFAEAMDLSESQVARVEAASARALDRLATLESERAELRSDDDDGEYFYVPPLGVEGEQILSDFRAETLPLLSEGVHAMVAAAASESYCFSRFGRYAQELSIEIQTDSNGNVNYLFDRRYLLDNGSRSASNKGRIYNIEQFSARYGKLFYDSMDR